MSIGAVMLLVKKLIPIALITCVPCFLLAQTTYFHHFNEKNGLSQNSVKALYQDSLGFLWAGTKEGLNRYDGARFRVFRHLSNDPTSLSNSYINCIFPGKNGEIWVGTESGLNCYNPALEQFKTYRPTGPPEASQFILSGTVDRRGYVWTGTYDGLFRLHPATGEWLHFPPDISLPNGVNHNAVWEIFEDSGGLLWIGTSNGLNVLRNDDKFLVEKYFHDPANRTSVGSTRVFGFAQTSDGTVWLATRNGLDRASGPPENLQFTHLRHNPADEHSISTDFIWAVRADADDHLWLATYNGGLNEVFWSNPAKSPGAEGDLEKMQVTRYQHDDEQPGSISHNEVNCTLRDRSGILWVGTEAGLDKLDPAGKRFVWVQNSTDAPRSLQSNHVQALHFDSRGDFWIGTRAGGLHRLNAKDRAVGKFEFEVLQNDPNDPTSLSHNDVFGLSEDAHGYLWIATYDGLNCLNLAAPGKPKFHRFTTADGLAHKFQYQVLQRKNGARWVATYGRLNRMDFDPANPSRTTFAEYNMDLSRRDALANATVHTLAEDRYGQLWAGTFNGLSKLVSADGAGVFENYFHRPGDAASLSNNFVKQLFLDSRKRLWAATRSGLNFIEQHSAAAPARVHPFGPADGLPGEAVQSIAEDSEGRLWLGTTGGLVLFDPDIALGNTGKSPVLNRFDYRDGLQGNEFSERAAICGPDGKMYFGGIHGLNIFDPENLWENPYVPPVVFTEFRLFNKVVQAGAAGSPLQNAITQTRTLTLQHGQNVIGFSFAALSFSQPEKNKYAYRMKGFDENWILAQNENAVTYTNLSPGRYRFEVKASNSSGLWNENPAYIDLLVLPPWWLTWWAYLLYGLAVIGAAVFYVRLREANVRRIERAKATEREYLRKQNAADFHDELGHRLTKIALFLELADRQKDDPPALSGQLLKVKRHVAGLSSGIRDLIWTLDPTADSLLQTLVRLREFGDALFERSGIEFQASGLEDAFENTRLDPHVRKHLLLLFKEAMNNCLKYSQAGSCVFKVEKTLDGIRFQLTDDGQGFDVENTKSGYGLRNMRERAEKIGATLAIGSSPGRGTTCSLDIKMPQMG